MPAPPTNEPRTERMAASVFKVGPCFRWHLMGWDHVLFYLARRPICSTREAIQPKLHGKESTRETGLDGPQRRVLCRREAQSSQCGAGEAALVSLGGGADLADRHH